jgi:uncharacterized low-complexity protein
MKPIKKTALALTATVTVAGACLVHAADSPFVMRPLSQGYLVATADPATDAKATEAKCGAAHAKAMDGKCGAATNGEGAPVTKTRAKTKKKAKSKATEAKCGEAKCGGMK